MELVDKADILADAWLTQRDNPVLSEFFAYHDLGPALAYALSNGIVLDLSKQGEEYIENSFDAFSEYYSVEEGEEV